MFEFEVTVEVLVAIVAAVLSFAFEYFPKIRQWYEPKPEHEKKQIMLGLLTLTAGGIFLGSCYGLFVTGLVCEAKTVFDLLYLVGLAVAVNQGTHRLIKKETRE